ncbi:MAG: ADP-ribosylglycohydrolase family protein, partial [Gemmatimonadaceae bacterium]|nr:ADP-ribosylglycohydrolase family protein [Gemmatimonadaceae bacterium]
AGVPTTPMRLAPPRGVGRWHGLRVPPRTARACLLGGAIGDALGAPVEFRKLADIRRDYGPLGITTFDEAYGVRGAITDDTQMTLFTAEGLLRGLTHWWHGGSESPATIARRSYLRWAATQRDPDPDAPKGATPLDDPRLAAQRAPGATCLAALRPRVSPERRIYARNDSKGCGTVMRVAPAGLLFDPAGAFTRGCDVSRITHGHPVGWLAGGAFAALVAHLVRGEPLVDAVAKVGERLLAAKAPDEASAQVARAMSTGFALGSMCGAALTPAELERLGGGWVAEEALAIAVACAAASPDDFATAVRMAVNHSGDSDSTGSMTGQLVGLLVGMSGIPREWRQEVELADLVTTVADDLAYGGPAEPWWRARWPDA